MKSIKFLLAFFFAICASSSYAYIIYNQTNQQLAVKDIYGVTGTGGIIPSKGQLECKSFLGGCKGTIWLYVFESFNSYRFLCGWKGKTNDKPGTAFIIKSIPGKTYPNDGWCEIEYRAP